MKYPLAFGVLAFFLSAAFLFNVGCANIVPPEGGPRDTLPPRLLHVSPADSTVNFHADKVVFTFDENIGDLAETQKNIMFTPIFEQSPAIEVRGKTITVPFKHGLDPNTTYILKFGEAVRDNNEGNIYHNLTYTFSTGPVLDSLTISGHVVLAETGAVDTTLVAILHSDLRDSAVVKHAPKYVTRIDRSGNFQFQNLPNDTFAVFVTGARRTYDPTQGFAFNDVHVVAGRADTLQMFAYTASPPRVNQNATGLALGGLKIPGNDKRLRITPKTTTKQDLLSDYIIDFGSPIRTFDSSAVHLSIDSIFSPVVYSVHLDSTHRSMRIQSDWKEDGNYNLVLEKQFATDSAGRQLNKSDTLFFTTSKKADYGNLVLHIRDIDTSRHPVLQFVQNNVVIRTVPFDSGEFRQALFPPGDYDLRVFYDRNRNGKLDPGNYFLRLQPEIAHPIKEKLTVKANWDNEIDLRY